MLVTVKCVSCGLELDPNRPQTTCTACGSMLSAEYDYEAIKETFSPSSVRGRAPSLWRYREVLPVADEGRVVSLGEGFTPVVSLGKGLKMKDDGIQPTGTFKARGMSVAVSRARELGISKLAVPSAGNAGAALACYAAAAGLRARVYMPTESPASTVKEVIAYGAELVQVEGNISDAARRMAEDADGSFDMSTLKEPYRLEGKKTMGYEVAEQAGFGLPDVVVYPTGGGTGLLGMWKAFDEMEELGWIGADRPRMVSVQSELCRPIVDAFAAGRESLDGPAVDGRTVASGLRVPRPFAARQILQVLRDSRGAAVAVPETSITSSMRSLAKKGLFVCPEGAATFAAYENMLSDGSVDRSDDVLLYNTGSGLKYLELF